MGGVWLCLGFGGEVELGFELRASRLQTRQFQCLRHFALVILEMAFHELFAQAGHLYHFLSSFSNCNKSDLKVEVISFSSLKHFGAGYWWLRPVILST